MNSSEYLENNISKRPAIDLLIKLGYEYISVEQCDYNRGNHYNVLLRQILKEQLEKINSYDFCGETFKFSEDNINRAVNELDEPLADNLVVSSEKVYDAIMLGKSFPETLPDGRTQEFNMKYIDWENPSNNVFHIAEEFSVHSIDRRNDTRLDIVLFINGIPFAVIECKSPLLSVDRAVEQMIRNQKNDYTPQLFKFAQVVMGTNTNNVKYATTGTAKKFWNVWREEDVSWRDEILERTVIDRTVTQQDKDIVSLLSPERLMEITRYFIVFDANIKKICRHQQFFAIRNIIKTINTFDEYGNRQGGVIWHTQGSGKSLTMVMLAKYILMEMSDFNPRVVIVTDRKDLDKQIASTFAHTRLSPAKASTGKHLIDLINSNKVDVITTVINKFTAAANQKVKLDNNNIFVLVDESHRSNYGTMAAKMRMVFTRGCYLGFTGTPLMKKERSTVGRFGGSGYIHKYTIKDGVEDKAIVPIIYEGRFIDQKVDEENIDMWFERTTKRLNEREREDLKKKWSSIKRLSSTDARINRIAMDIDVHFTESIKDTGMKAMLAVNFKRDAVRYLEAFELLGNLNCAVVISAPDKREGEDDILSETDNKVIAYWNKMMKQYGNEDKYEDALKDKFIDGEIDILIVCSKLLTGFDAPLCQVLYIDKELKEHALLQAIARTNRICEGKDFGLVVDYRGLIKKLDDAMNMYSGAGLEGFDGSEISGAVIDVMKAVGDLRNAHSQIIDMFSLVRNKTDVNEFSDSLEDEKRRNDFYNRLCDFGKSLSLVVGSEKAYDAVPDDLMKKFKNDFIFFSKLRQVVKLRYSDAVDNKEYEPIMQNLLDRNLSVTGLKKITAPVDILDSQGMEEVLSGLNTDRAKADAIRYRLTRSIALKRDENPAFYQKFSEKIEKALEQYRNQIISEAEYLSRMNQIKKDYSEGKVEIQFPSAIQHNSNAQVYYYIISTILNERINAEISDDIKAELSLEIAKIMQENCKVDWESNTEINKKINREFDYVFYCYSDKYEWGMTVETQDAITETIKQSAHGRY